VIMNVEDLDLAAAAGRYPFQITDRLTVVVMQPVEDEVIVAWFFDGELVRILEEAAGEA
jgi:hypothetical protein